MPIYEYLCTKCDDLFEVMQKMSDRPLRKCKKCNGKLEKQVSRTAFQLKGGGWFDSGYTKSGGGSTKTSKSGKSESGTKSESKSKKDGKSGSGTKSQLTAAS